MSPINKNKGFEAMIPKPKEEPKPKLLDKKVTFRLCGKEFSFSFSITT